MNTVTVDDTQIGAGAGAKGRIEEVKLNTKKSRYETAKEYPTVKMKRRATATEEKVYLRPVMLLL